MLLPEAPSLSRDPSIVHQVIWAWSQQGFPSREMKVKVVSSTFLNFLLSYRRPNFFKLATLRMTRTISYWEVAILSNDTQTVLSIEQFVCVCLCVCDVMQLMVRVGATWCPWSQWAGTPSVTFYFQVTRHLTNATSLLLSSVVDGLN